MNSGGVFYLPTGIAFDDTSSSFLQNAATLGGNFYCDGCTMAFTSTTFRHSIGYDGGNIYMLNDAAVTFNNVNM